MKQVRVVAIPEGVRVAVFGIATEQMVVDGDPLHTYASTTGNAAEIVVDLDPPSSGVIIRFFGREFRFSS